MKRTQIITGMIAGGLRDVFQFAQFLTKVLAMLGLVFMFLFLFLLPDTLDNMSFVAHDTILCLGVYTIFKWIADGLDGWYKKFYKQFFPLHESQ